MVCRTCGGTGGITSTKNGAGYWAMDYGEPCPDCVEIGICPRCETEMKEVDDSGSYCCPKCGWDEATGDIVKEGT